MMERSPQFSLLDDSHPALRRRRPAEMSPEEFRDHPDTVFHSSAHPFPKTTADIVSVFPGIHAGTEQAALEIAANRPYRGDDLDSLLNADPADTVNTMYRINTHDNPLPTHGWGSLDEPASDASANSKNILKEPHPVAYHNEHEDEDRLSVVFPERYKHMLQGDYVATALKTGEPVHPRTKAMYDMGNLDDHDKVTSEQAEQMIDYPEKYVNHEQPSMFPFTSTYKDYRRHTSGSRLVSREEIGSAIRETNPNHGVTSLEGFPYHDLHTGRAMHHVTTNAANENTYADPTAEKYDHVSVAYGRPPRVSDRGDVGRSRQFKDVG